VQLYEQVVNDSTSATDHYALLAEKSNLAEAYLANKLVDLALPILAGAMAERAATLGEHHADTLASREALAKAYKDAGKLDLAIEHFQRVLKAREANPAEHPALSSARSNLASAYESARKWDLAIPLHQSNLQALEARWNPDHRFTFFPRVALARCYVSAGRTADALRVYEVLIPQARRQFGEESPQLQPYLRQWLIALEAEKQFAQAIEVRQQLLAADRQRFAADSFQVALSLHQLGQTLLKAARPAEAEPVLRECLAIREKTQALSPATMMARSDLGAALLGQKKYAEAEPLLVAAYEGLKRQGQNHLSATPLKETLERLINLAEATGKQEQAAKWQSELETLNPK
jgi:tetratricopeptide (TPR) repeat protein